MNHETGSRSAYGAAFEAVLAPICGLAEGILHGVSVMLRKLERRRAARRRKRAVAVTMRELYRLEDRVLRDIGITRHDVRAVAGAVVGDPKVDVRDLLRR